MWFPDMEASGNAECRQGSRAASTLSHPTGKERCPLGWPGAITFVGRGCNNRESRSQHQMECLRSSLPRPRSFRTNVQPGCITECNSDEGAAGSKIGGMNDWGYTGREEQRRQLRMHSEYGPSAQGRTVLARRRSRVVTSSPDASSADCQEHEDVRDLEVSAEKVIWMYGDKRVDLHTVMNFLQRQLSIIEGLRPNDALLDEPFRLSPDSGDQYSGDLGYWYPRGDGVETLPAGSPAVLREGSLYEPRAELEPNEMLVVVSDHNVKYKGGYIPMKGSQEEKRGHWCAWIGVVQMQVKECV
eukprot:TRINITY_DN28259_c0_g1_i2.p1 TRINITY_DN28259_c0_g1~~TRINITY_DN28259_c0_g1_i2.p1  ORF type:complete len:300 (-),score=21.23 TRINITY_DN28259_c0_g1_i2:4-903(-)